MYAKAGKENDIKKQDDYDKIHDLLEEINAAKKTALFDTTLEIKPVNSTKIFKQEMKLAKKPAYKTFEYIHTSKLKNDKIEFENYLQLFENIQLAWKSDDFKSMTGS